MSQQREILNTVNQIRTDIKNLTSLVKRVLSEQAQLGEEIMADIDNLEAELAAETDAGQAMANLLDRIFQMLQNAGTDPARIQAVIATVQANKQKWIDATLRDTPADPNA